MTLFTRSWSALLSTTFDASLADVDALLVGTGRLVATEAELRAFGAAAARVPLVLG